MKNQVNFCTACEYEIVPGVACDGVIRESPHPAGSKVHNGAASRYAKMLETFVGQLDYDAIRSDA